VKRLIDPAVMIVAMIVPALDPQSLEKTAHLSPHREVICSAYGDSVNPL